ncbi:hypothetical protein [Chengkuizengella marina]|uniref:Uncharacterized protein n=1 Tax=Chengkuizengella marina TaxID=2507566 RepID=A0A6N9Q8Q3_9BACL|nr:hypothetical protein [Chengkuizengella marina]NBI31100.1 hypothetical protein [Chengkuizengella marina]
MDQMMLSINLILNEEEASAFAKSVIQVKNLSFPYIISLNTIGKIYRYELNDDLNLNIKEEA